MWAWNVPVANPQVCFRFWYPCLDRRRLWGLNILKCVWKERWLSLKNCVNNERWETGWKGVYAFLRVSFNKEIKRMYLPGQSVNTPRRMFAGVSDTLLKLLSASHRNMNGGPTWSWSQGENHSGRKEKYHSFNLSGMITARWDWIRHIFSKYRLKQSDGRIW